MSSETPVVIPQPAAGAVIPQWAVVTLTILSVVAGIALSIPSLPPLAHQIAGAVVALAAALGIASPGIRRTVTPPAPSNVVNLEQAAAELRKGPPAP